MRLTLIVLLTAMHVALTFPLAALIEALGFAPNISMAMAASVVVLSSTRVANSLKAYLDGIEGCEK